MPGPYPIELRERIVRHVEGGATHRATAAKFEVSIKFVNDMMKLKRETGALKPRRLGNPGSLRQNTASKSARRLSGES